MLVHCVTDFYFDVAGVVRLRLSTGRVVYTPCCIRRHALKRMKRFFNMQSDQQRITVRFPTVMRWE